MFMYESLESDLAEKIPEISGAVSCTRMIYVYIHLDNYRNLFGSIKNACFYSEKL